MKKAFLFSLGLILAFSSVFVSCVEDDGLTVYTVSVSSEDNGSASIKDNEATSLSVTQGNRITVVATPNDGYEFVGWFLMDKTTSISIEPIYTFVVSNNISLIAKFELKSIDGYKYVDLGLPSGLKWAACNVGATVPEGYGSYFAWGETEEKENYSWETYKWCNGSEETITKYLAGVTEERGVLELEDDVAHVKWGGGWRMPTISEQEELVKNCSWEWTTLNDVNGYKVTGPNSIFLPSSASITGTEVNGKGEWGDYWANSIRYRISPYSINFNSNMCSNAASSRFRGHAVRPVHGEYVVNKVSVNCDGGGRVKINGVVTTSIVVAHSSEIDIDVVPGEDCNFVGWFNGESETPVSTKNRYEIMVNEDISLTAKFEKKTVEVRVWVEDDFGGKAIISNNNEDWIRIKIGETVTLRAVPDDGGVFDCWTTSSGKFISNEATYTFVVEKNTHILAKFKVPSKAIDLGLSVKWAECNVGATAPEECGGYYAWGETEEKDDYSWSTYKWCNGSYDTMTKYCANSSYGTVDNKTTLDPEDDVAHVKWGGDWRMPTRAEWDELLNECTLEWTTQNGVNGYRVTGPNGNSIFLPAAGCRYGSDVDHRGDYGGFWSSSLYSYNNDNVSMFGFFDSDNFYWYHVHVRYRGLSVRPVTK